MTVSHYTSVRKLFMLFKGHNPTMELSTYTDPTKLVYYDRFGHIQHRILKMRLSAHAKQIYYDSDMSSFHY